MSDVAKTTPFCSARPAPSEPRPSRDEAERAIRTLLLWAGDDPSREGLRDTPARVARAYEDWFSGYNDDPEEFLLRTFEEVEGYDDMVVLKDIRFEIPLRASPGADHRPRPYRLPAEQQGRGHLQARARRGSLCAPPAGAGKR